MASAWTTSRAALQEAQASASCTAEALRQLTERHDAVTAELQVRFLHTVIHAGSLPDVHVCIVL